MKRFNKKLIAFGLAACMSVAALAALAGCGGGDANTFTIWMIPNDGVWTNYDDLNKNPVIQYLEYKFDINLEFLVPSASNAGTNFNLITSQTSGYPDVMELSYYTGSVVDFVDYGLAEELTKHIFPSSGESLFPNYKALLEKDSEIRMGVSTIDNRYLALYSATDEGGTVPWGGYMYRRDLLLKYATAADAEGEANPANWTSGNDVRFPSGAIAPDLISDYDWLFNILKRAKDAGELDYVTTLYYPGYLETGDLVSAWGITPMWYREVVNGKTQIKFGGDTDEFKAYIAKMHEWWEKGYLDKDFSTRNQDQFFTIDSGAVAAGKVGCFFATNGTLGNTLYESSKGKVPADIDVRAAYMPRLTKDDEPIAFYQDTRIGKGWMVTRTAMKKNYEKLFAALDYLYSDEGSMMVRAGLNQAQYAEMIAAGKTKFWDTTVALNDEERAVLGTTATTAKLSEIGAYYFNERENINAFWQDVENNPAQENTEVSQCAMSFWGLTASSKLREIHVEEADYEGRYIVWAAYKDVASIPRYMKEKFTSEENSDYTIKYNAINDYMTQEVPKFIKGTLSLDTGWSNFCKNLTLKGSAINKNYWQKVYDALEG